MDKSKVLLKEFLEENRGNSFQAIKDGPTRVGHLFETKIGIPENNSSTADFYGRELKTVLRWCGKRRSNPVVRCGTMSCGNESRYLDLYGKMCKKGTYSQFIPTFKVGQTRTFQNGDKATLHLDYDGLVLEVADSFHDSHWPFGSTSEDDKTITSVVMSKLKNMAVVHAEGRIVNGVEDFRFHAIDFFDGLDVPRVIWGLSEGLIVVEFRKNSLKDSGTALTVKFNDLKKLYLEHEHFSV